MERTDPAPKIRLLVVDDDDLTRDGLESGLSAEEAFIIQEAKDGHCAVQYYKDERPDVVLVDLKMPFMSGIETMREMKKIDDGVPIVIMTGHGDIPTAVEAMKEGAYDFIVKPPEPDVLIKLLKEAAKKSTQKVRNAPSSFTDEANLSGVVLWERYNTLTPREQEIFLFTAHGLTSTQIADRFLISDRTVESHRENLMKKLSARAKADLVRMAIRLGLI